MSDYKGIFSNDFDDYEQTEPIFRTEREYVVRVMHRTTLEVYWTGTVTASSGKGAQVKWRKEYPHIRSKYNPREYCLGISKKAN